MREPAQAELLRSLGRVARGLSTLFWGLPLTFIAHLETARTPGLSAQGIWACAPAVILNGALLFGLGQLRDFQKQERIWQNALTRAEILSLVNLGLSPFVFWWRRFPDIPYFTLTIGLLVLSNLLFLMQLNRMLQRLTAMIPDETLRAETSIFASLNIWLLAGVFVALSAWYGAWTWTGGPAHAPRILGELRLHGMGAVLFLTLMPLALTMALLWKIKEVVFAGVFSHAD